MADSLSPGTVLQDRFRVERSISLGGWGEVYRGLDLKSGRPVAIKRALPIDPNGRDDEFEATYAFKRFLEEVKVLQNLDCIGIPKCLSSFAMPESRHCLVMEFIEGVDLERQVQDHLKLAGGLPPASTSVDYVIQACKILEYLHGLTPHPIVHRDVKPSNLILRHLDNRIYLVDFGFARPIGPSIGTKTMVGTIGYAPIEQCQGNPSPLSDQYAVGATLHYLLTGKQPTPFDIEPLDRTRPELPAALVRAVATATRNDKGERYNSIYSFRRELERLLPELRSLEAPDLKLDPGDSPPSPPTEEVPVVESRAVEKPPPPPAPVVAPVETVEIEEESHFQLPRPISPARRPALTMAQGLMQAAIISLLLGLTWMLWSSSNQQKQLKLASDILPGWQAKVASGLQPGAAQTIRLQASSLDDSGLSRLLRLSPSGFIIARAGPGSAPHHLNLELAATDPSTFWLLVGQEGEESYRIYRVVTLVKSNDHPTVMTCNVYHEGNRSLPPNGLIPPTSEGGYLLPSDGDDILHTHGLNIELRASNLDRLGVVMQSSLSSVLVRVIPSN